MKNLLVVDGNSILNRAFFGIRPLSTKEGLPTNAVYGFITIIKKHLDTLRPDYAVCAFDLKAPTFRHEKCDFYKANRKPMPEDLAVQLPYAKQAAEVMGLHVLECGGFEADDIIGTVCRMGDEAGDVHSYALTGDRDSLQLITETTSVILAKTKEDVLFTPERFFEEYGVAPSQFIDVKALMGDSSDNIPGVKGIGEKTAFKLISEKETLEGVYEDIDSLSIGKSAKEKLRDGREDAFLSRWLATIVKNAPVGPELASFSTKGPSRDKLYHLCTSLEFSALFKRFDFTSDNSEKREVTTTEAEIPKIEGSTGDFSSLEDGYAVSLSGDGRLVIATSDKLYAVSLGDTDTVKRVLSRPVICHDYKRLYRELSDVGFDVACSFDTSLAAYLLSPGNSEYGIEKLVFNYLHFDVPDDFGAEAEAFFAFKLADVLMKELTEREMMGVLTDIEIPLSRVLAGIERRGMKIDTAGLDTYNGELIKYRDSLEAQVFALAGHEFNLNSPKQLGTVLFEEMKLPVIKKTKSGYSTNAEVLQSLRPYHEIVDTILHFREVSKLISTYTGVLPGLADENGRVHTAFNQTGTATGRLSSNEPNLQNIPVRGEIGREIRKYFIADSGKVLVDADYSQIELRVLAEISEDENMISRFLSGNDIHTATAASVFGVSEFMVDSDLRRRAKAVNFGIVYGIGAFSLSKDLGISRATAAEYIENYLKTYPSVDSYLKRTVEEAKRDLYTVTAFGRRRPIPELASSNKNMQAFGERVAMNSPIQGTAADIIKIAMINCDRALKNEGIDARIIMQVHDELIVEAAENDAERAAEILKTQMEQAVKTKVPMRADVSVGKNWLEAKG